MKKSDDIKSVYKPVIITVSVIAAIFIIGLVVAFGRDLWITQRFDDHLSQDKYNRVGPVSVRLSIDQWERYNKQDEFTRSLLDRAPTGSDRYQSRLDRINSRIEERENSDDGYIEGDHFRASGTVSIRNDSWIRSVDIPKDLIHVKDGSPKTEPDTGNTIIGSTLRPGEEVEFEFSFNKRPPETVRSEGVYVKWGQEAGAIPQ